MPTLITLFQTLTRRTRLQANRQIEEEENTNIRLYLLLNFREIHFVRKLNTMKSSFSKWNSLMNYCVVKNWISWIVRFAFSFCRFRFIRKEITFAIWFRFISIFWCLERKKSLIYDEKRFVFTRFVACRIMMNNVPWSYFNCTRIFGDESWDGRAASSRRSTIMNRKKRRMN